MTCLLNHRRRGFGWTRRLIDDGTPPESLFLVPYGGGMWLESTASLGTLRRNVE